LLIRFHPSHQYLIMLLSRIILLRHPESNRIRQQHLMDEIILEITILPRYWIRIQPLDTPFDFTVVTRCTGTYLVDCRYINKIDNWKYHLRPLESLANPNLLVIGSYMFPHRQLLSQRSLTAGRKS
jgi:hypothetical protein